MKNLAGDNLQVVYHSSLLKTSASIKKRGTKRPANCFILFRQEMMKKERPHKMTMTEYSKRVAGLWQNLSEGEKIKWRRQYEINRDVGGVVNETN